ncbi:MAG: HAD hydrolase family protein, partial [Chitinispirillia bacterium]
MKKILYVTDLDGTLLNSKSELSLYSKSKVIALLNQNVNITVASLRSIITINSILKDIPFKLPVIEMNGAFLTDFKSNKKLLVNSINSEITESLISIVKKYSFCPIIYCYHNNKDIMYIGDINNNGIEWYYKNRKQ